MAAPLFTNRMIAVNPDRTWSFDALRQLQSVVSLAGGDTGAITASRITVSPTGGLSSTDAQSAFAELDAEKATVASVTAHTGNTSNPHSVTKTQVGLGNVDNTSDANKPVSTAQAAADAAVQAFAIQRSNHTGSLSLASGSIGYATGNGGTVTQNVSKSTGVTLNELSGEVTMNAAALAAGAIESFVLTNSTAANTDVVILNHVAGGTIGAYSIEASSGVGAITFYVRNNTAGSLSEAIVIRFAVIKAATS